MNSHRWIAIGLLSLLVIIIVGNTMMASVPPVSRDALIHHLAIPKLFLQHGEMIEIPDIPFSYYPMNLDLLYLIPLVFGNDIIPKYIHMLFGLFTGWLVFHYLKSRISVNYGLTGMLLWLSIPIVTRLSSEVYVDLGLAFFSFASLFQVICWVNCGFLLRHLIYAAIFCGLALGTKYNALLCLAVLSLMVPFLYSRFAPGLESVRMTSSSINTTATWQKKNPIKMDLEHSIRALKYAIYFVVIALVVFSPWMVRNVILKQNPIYPMMNSVFNPDQQKANDKWSRAASIVQQTGSTLSMRRLVFKESFGYMALIPIRIFFEGEDDDPRRFDGKLNPFLLFFLIAGLWGSKNCFYQLRVERWIWFSYSLLFLTIVIFTAPIRVRYLTPILPAIVILSIFGIYDIHNAIDRYKNSFIKYYSLITILIVMLMGMFLYNGNYYFERFRTVAPLTYLSGQVSRNNYITQRRPEFPLVLYANAHLTTGDRILCLFIGQRRYYFDKDVTFNEGLLLGAVRRATSPYQIMANLKEENVTHLMIRIDLFTKWLSINMTSAEMEKLDVFWRMHMHKLKDNNGFALFALRE